MIGFKHLLATGLLGLANVELAFAAFSGQVVGKAVPEVSKMNIWNSVFALLLVLVLFFACVWMLRKMNYGGNVAHTHKLKVVGGIALGMREKVVLLQVGDKQLVLAVTPGRIETLTVLEGDACLNNNVKAINTDIDASFAQKLMQALKNRSDV